MKLGAQPGLTSGAVPDRPASSRTAIVAAWDFRLASPPSPARTRARTCSTPPRQLPDAGDDRLQLGRARCSTGRSRPRNTARSISTTTISTTPAGTTDFDMDGAGGHQQQFYATKLTTDDGDEDYVPFWVVPRSAAPRPRSPSSCRPSDYMAYANEHLANNAGSTELLIYRMPIMQQQNMFLSEHREYGDSLYDTHSDGAGLRLSSRLRPILNFRPKVRSLPGVRRRGSSSRPASDRLADRDGLRIRRHHRRGHQLRRPGAARGLQRPDHRLAPRAQGRPLPRRASTATRSAAAGSCIWAATVLLGALLPPGYTAGRGVVTEMRRCESGIRPGRRRARRVLPPGRRQARRYVAVPWAATWHAVAAPAWSAQGFDVSTYFKRTPESERSARGLGFRRHRRTTRQLGDFGLVGGGAAGAELDIVDTMLGSVRRTRCWSRPRPGCTPKAIYW